MITVRVYSAPWCGGCKVVKKVLTENNIKFDEVDISTKDGGLLAKEMDLRSIPVTTVYGKAITNVQHFIGSKPETLKQILEAIND